MAIIDEVRKILSREDAGTATASMPFGKLIAPKGAKDMSGLTRIIKRGFEDDEVSEEMSIPQASTAQNMVSVTPMRQSTGYCGPAALACLLNFYGAGTTELEVADRCGATHDDGVTPEGLKAGVESFGFDATFGDAGSPAKIAAIVGNERIPLMIFWWGHGRRGDGPHVSLVVGYDDKNVMLMDPEPGLVVAKAWDKFLKSWFRFESMPSADGLKVGEYLIVRPKD